MSALVPDASVLVATLCDGGDLGRWAERTLASAAGAMAAPELVFAEVANILRRAEAAGGLDAAAATAAHADLARLDLVAFPYAPFAVRVWELRGNLTAYDAWYVALAEGLDAPLATCDERLARSPGPRCRFLTPG